MIISLFASIQQVSQKNNKKIIWRINIQNWNKKENKVN